MIKLRVAGENYFHNREMMFLLEKPDTAGRKDLFAALSLTSYENTLLGPRYLWRAFDIRPLIEGYYGSPGVMKQKYGHGDLIFIRVPVSSSVSLLSLKYNYVSTVTDYFVWFFPPSLK